MNKKILGLGLVLFTTFALAGSAFAAVSDSTASFASPTVTATCDPAATAWGVYASSGTAVSTNIPCTTTTLDMTGQASDTYTVIFDSAAMDSQYSVVSTDGTSGGSTNFTYTAPVVPATDVYVDGSAATDGTGTQASPYQTIAEALSNVALNGTVHVAAGTYAGTVTIGQGVTLSGPMAGTAGSATRDTGSNEAVFTSGAPVISVNTTDAVTITGFEFNGTGSPVSATVNSNVTISDDIIKNETGNATLYFAATGTTANAFTFEDNYLTNLSTGNDEGIFFAGNWNGSAGTTVTITGNTFEHSDMTGMNLSNVSGSIANNTFTDIEYYGILLANNDSPMTITGNTFDGIRTDGSNPTYGAGIRFYTPSNTGSVTITGNTFENSHIGIAVRAGSDISGQDISVTGNTFTNNDFDFYSDGTSGTLNGENNTFTSGTPVVGGSGSVVATSTSSIVVVHDSDLATDLSTAGNKWFFYNDTTDTLDDSLGSMVTGPGTVPLGLGSAELDAPASTGVILVNGGFAGTRLDHITSLGYSTYKDPSDDAVVDPALGFDIDNDVTDSNVSYMGRLVYEPYFTHDITAGAWQTWNPMDDSTLGGHGNWWFSHANLATASGCTQATPCTWAQVLAAFPNAGISGGVDFKAGTWTDAFKGNVDAFQIGIQSGSTVTTTTYDFDPVALTTSGGGGSGTGTGGNGGGSIAITPGDLNGDGRVDLKDFNLLMAAWGATGTGLTADINHDGTVGILDFNLMLSNWTV